MHSYYKRHLVVVIARLLPNSQEWEAQPLIDSNERGEFCQYLSFDKRFPTRAQAEKEGLRLAMKWIDDGKPSSQFTTTGKF